MNILRPKLAGPKAIVFGLCAAAIYLLMIRVTLAHIETLAGHAPFDMRPFGYGPAEAAALLGALGAGGRAYYISYQLPLDTLYPTLLALTLTMAMCWFGDRTNSEKLVRVGVILAVGAALFDYAENLGIVFMIWSWPNLSSPMVHAASTATVLKSIFTTLAVLQMLLIGFLWARAPRLRLRP